MSSVPQGLVGGQIRVATPSSTTRRSTSRRSSRPRQLIPLSYLSLLAPPPVDPLLPPLHALFSLACAPVDTEIVHDIGCAFVTTTHGVSVPPAPRIRSPVATMAHTGAPRCCSSLWRSIPLYPPFCSSSLRPWLRVYLQPGC